MMKNARKLLFARMALSTIVLGFGTVVQAQEPQVSAPPSIQPAAHVKVSGIITERNNDALTIRLASAQSLTVKLNSMTQIRERKSNPFRKGRRYIPEQLIPGLAVEIEGRGDGTGVMAAEKILITNDDLRMAQVMDARVTPVERNSMRMSGQLSELNAVSNAARGGAKAAQSTADNAHLRITALDDYDEANRVFIQFKAGSALLSETAKRSLDELAAHTKGLKGFVIEIAGFASSEGSLAFNKRLSRQRAEAVSEYLAETHDIPLRRIMTPTGYGVSHPVSDNASIAGRRENRRVEVRLMTSRGIATQASTLPETTDEQ